MNSTSVLRPLIKSQLFLTKFAFLILFISSLNVFQLVFASEADSKVINVPLQASQQWQDLKFKSFKQNQVQFSSDELLIQVEESSSPLIFGLEQKAKIKAIKVKGEASQLLKLNQSLQQGEKGKDDFLLKIGLIVPGKMRLNAMQRMIAAEWLVRLQEMAPKNEGLKEVFFLSAVQNKQLLGKERKHPSSDLIREKNVWLIDQPGAFSFEYQLPTPVEARALWIASDGDDTGSKFQLKIQELELVTQ